MFERQDITPVSRRKGGNESPVTGEGEGFCVPPDPCSASLKRHCGKPALSIIGQTSSAMTKRAPRDEGVLGCELSLIPCQAATIYWRWVCEVEVCQRELGTGEMETANSQGVVFGKIHY